MKPYAKAAVLCPPLLLCTIIHIYFLIQAVPLRDDFSRACVTQPLLQYLHGSYRSWSGRLVAHGLEAGLAGHVHLTDEYHWLLALISFGFLAGCYAFVGLIARPNSGIGQRLTLTWLIATILWSAMPHPGEVFYWFTGGVEYMLPVAGSLIVLAWLRWIENKSWRKRIWRSLHIAALMTVAFLICGLHEALAFVFLFFLCLMLGDRLWRREPRALRSPLIPLIAVVAIGALLSLLAPGNVRRHDWYSGAMEEFGREQVDLFRSLLWIMQTYIAKFLLSPSLLLLSAVVLLGGSSHCLQPAWLERDRIRLRILLPLLCLILPLGIMCLALAGGLDQTPPRLVDAAFIVYVFSLIPTLLAWLPESDEKQPAAASDRRIGRIESLTFVLFALSLASTGNAFNAASDYFMRLGAWTAAHHAHWDQARDASARGAGHIVLEPLPPTPLMYPDAALSDNPDFPLNSGYAKYWGLDSLVVQTQPNE